MTREKLIREISGIILVLAALYYMGALLSFHPDDEAVVLTIPWYEMFSENARILAQTIHSPFGLFGTRVSSFFIRSMFGYLTVIPALPMLFTGWALLNLRSLKSSLLFFIYAVLISLDLSIMFGLTTAPFADLMSGAVGRMLAALLSTVIGQVGAWALVVTAGMLLTFYMGKGVLVNVASLLKSFFNDVVRFINAGQLFFQEKKREREEKKKRKRDLQQQRATEKQQKSMETERRMNVAKTSTGGVDPLPPVPSSDMPAEGRMVPQPESFRRPFVSQQPEEEVAPLSDAPFVAGRKAGGFVTEPEPVVGAPEMIIRQGVHEKEADLDERSLKVKTRDRVPYRFPSIDLLQKGKDDDGQYDESHLEESRTRLLDKLNIYKIDVLRIETTVGPRVTLFELELAPDVKISRVKALENDLAMALAARGIRIIAPIPGKNAVGVEIPNGKPKTVMMRSVLQVEKFKNSTRTKALPIVLGRTISNEVQIDDLATMPHLLIAGATGAGKSVGINVILTSLLYAKRPDELKLVLIDPKRVELFQYQHLKNHFLARFPGFEEQIVTDPAKAVIALKSVVREMEYRYQILEQSGVRNIGDYNRKNPDEAMFYIVVVIDELADLMITAGREVEEPITRLAQLARAVGIHLIVATQRPSVDIITGIIKANFPSRIAFQVASKVDSRTILDGSGADQLLGNGDMLFQPSSMPKPIRVQCPYVSSEEVEAITSFIGSQPAMKEVYVLPVPPDKGSGQSASQGGQSGDGRDSMFEDAARLIVLHQQASVSLLQRRLRLGFSRAGRVMDQLELYGIVSSQDGSKPREVLIKSEESLELLLNNL